jgi:hypothetical protein
MRVISWCFCPLRSHLRSDNRFAVVAPRTALVIDDIGDLGVAERAGKGWHRATVDQAPHLGVVQTSQHNLDVLRGLVVVDDGVAFERRERARQAFAVGLMARRAVSGEQCGTLGRVVTTPESPQLALDRPHRRAS